MANLKKVGTLLTASVLSFSLFSSAAYASTAVMEQSEKVQIQVASTELIFTKSDLVKKFHEFFPNQFDFLTDSDFHMGGSHFYTDDDALRYALSFSKTINGKQIHGSVGFVGENLDIEQFYYQPADESEALFPPKVSKDEARKTATNFIQSFPDGDKYQLDTDTFNYFPRQVLTEPIRYSFSYVLTKNQVAVSDQRIEVSVLGNGDIVGFYRNPMMSSSSTFDDVKKIKDKNETLEKVKENLSVDLQYQVLFDYRTEDRKVELVYQPTTNLRGTHAISGQWITANGYAADFPKTPKTEKLVANPLPPKQNGITLEEAKKVAQQLLKSDSDKVKLNIQSVSEIDNMDGQTIISIEYMYEYENGGYGTSLYINKQTGEITQYSDATAFFNEQNGEKPNLEDSISSREALNQAISYLKEWVPSYLHNYAMPVDEFYFDERQGTYHFSFPRMVNDIVVIGDNISVSIAGDGSLSSLNVNYQEVDQWPSSDKVISKEDATKILTEALSLNLTYVKDEKKESDPHYDLVYLPVFNEKAYSFLNATTGEWNSLYDAESSLTISHPWAEEELNYLVDAKILDIKNNDFNADASVSRGEAIKIIMNSLTYVYDGGYYYGNEEKNQTFENIDPKHPLYSSIERAVATGIIQQDSKHFDVNAPVKREELAAWYVRVLGLEQAAKHSNIYKLDILDANKVQAEYTGYVALASAMGLLKTEQNLFNPDREVTYADLAVSIIPLAHEMSAKSRGLSY